MKRIIVLVACASIIPIIAAGCSSSSAGGDTTTDAGSDGASSGTDGATEAAADDPLNCIAPGTKGNELGMGGYCTPGGHQCDTAGPAGAARLCSADYAAPAHAWFCTYPCDVDNDCGSGEFCVHNAAGSGCVPNVCAYLEGSDGGSDDGAAADSGDD